MKRNRHVYILSFCVIILVMLFSPLTVFANSESTTSITQLKQNIAAEMTNRETTFTIHYTGDANQVMTDIKSIFVQAQENNNYLSLSWKKVDYSITTYSNYCDIAFTAEYHTTKEEEEFIDSHVKVIISNLITSDMRDLEKVTAIHNWIIDNISYDFTLQQTTAYTALKTGKTVCMGYSMLMEKMLNQAGIASRIITGNIPQGYHAWNMIKIDNSWYYLDLTSDWFAGSKIPKIKTERELIQENYVWDKEHCQQVQK